MPRHMMRDLSHTGIDVRRFRKLRNPCDAAEAVVSARRYQTSSILASCGER
jgi:hypothetical protein